MIQYVAQTNNNLRISQFWKQNTVYTRQSSEGVLFFIKSCVVCNCKYYLLIQQGWKTAKGATGCHIFMYSQYPLTVFRQMWRIISLSHKESPPQCVTLTPSMWCSYLISHQSAINGGIKNKLASILIDGYGTFEYLPSDVVSNIVLTDQLTDPKSHSL